MIKGLFFAVVIFLVGTFPATWLLMLFLGNVHVERVVLGRAAPGRAGVRGPRGTDRELRVTGVRPDRVEIAPWLTTVGTT